MNAWRIVKDFDVQTEKSKPCVHAVKVNEEQIKGVTIIYWKIPRVVESRVGYVYTHVCADCVLDACSAVVVD